MDNKLTRRRSARSRTPASPAPRDSKRARLRSGTGSPASPALQVGRSRGGGAALRRSMRRSSVSNPLYAYTDSSEDASPESHVKKVGAGKKTAKVVSVVTPNKKTVKAPTPRKKTVKTSTSKKKGAESSESSAEEEESEDSGSDESQSKTEKRSAPAVKSLRRQKSKRDSTSRTEDENDPPTPRKSQRSPKPRQRLIDQTGVHNTASAKVEKVAISPEKTAKISFAKATKYVVSKKESKPDTSSLKMTIRKKAQLANETDNETPEPSTTPRSTRKTAQKKPESNKATPAASTTRTSRNTSQSKAKTDNKATPGPSTTPRATRKTPQAKADIEAGPGSSTTPRATRKTPQTKPDIKASAEPSTTPRATRKKPQGKTEAEPGNEATATPDRSRSAKKVVSTANEATPRTSRRLTLKRDEEKITFPVKTKAAPQTKASVSKTDQGTKGIENAQHKVLEWKFNVYGVPKCPLPCRETQFEEIWKFLFENVIEKNSGCMYVSGVRATGKTVIVQAVVNTLQKLTEDKKKSKKFQYLYVNGLTLASPDKIWKRMFKGLGLPNKYKGISIKEALKRFDSYFEGHQRDPVILVVDELDHILDKQQSILYQLLEWSSHARNMFSFVAIFNTMSLPENGLAMSNYSRMGFKRAVFPPYSYEQLQTIVSNILSTFKTVRLNTECVSLLSRKVAAISGDARRALEIARRTMEIAETGNLSGIQAVSNAFKEIFSSAKIETLKHTSLLEQLILKSICDDIRCNGVEEVLVAKIIESVVPKAAYEGMNWPKDEILKAMMRLAVMRVLIVEDNSISIHKRVVLKVPVEDVNFALGIHTDLVA